MSLNLYEFLYVKYNDNNINGTAINKVTISLPLKIEITSRLSLYIPSKNIPPIDIKVATAAIINETKYNLDMLFCFNCITPFYFRTSLNII